MNREEIRRKLLSMTGCGIHASGFPCDHCMRALLEMAFENQERDGVDIEALFDLLIDMKAFVEYSEEKTVPQQNNLALVH